MTTQRKSLVIAPHPDDEVLGVGGTLLRRKTDGSKIGWLIMTCATSNYGWSKSEIDKRHKEIEEIKSFFNFDYVRELKHPTTKLDVIPRSDLVMDIRETLLEYQPTEIFVPHYSDVHSDHRITFESVMTSAKWFRCPSVKKMLAYETLSETEFGLDETNSFKPNYYVDIEEFLEKKIKAMEIYKSEIDSFPFPRSKQVIESLAIYRGAAAGYKAAEAFQLLREYE